MTPEASTFLAAALKSATLNGTFSPADVGARIGMDRHRAEAAARWLSNAGVLSLGFDQAANFTPEYRKAHAPAAKKARGAKANKK
jgi:hypothetical protein